MKRMLILVWLVLALVVVGLGYIRLAPSDPAKWHRLPGFTQDQDLPGGVMRVVQTGPEGLKHLDAIARDWPRTKVVSGSVGEGMVTYVTRTKWMGFPDYTTVHQQGDQIRIYARLRFGQRDFDVNRTRVTGWLQALGF